MKRETYTGTARILPQADPIGTVTKYAHNTALRAATDLLRDHARGGYWERVGHDKTPDGTIVYYRHDDGRQAVITVERPKES